MKKKIIGIVACIVIVGGIIAGICLVNKSKAVVKEPIHKIGVKEVDFTDAINHDVVLENGTTTIFEGGIYTLKDVTTEGYIKVNTKDNVKLVLENVNLTNNNGPAIYVEKVKNLVVSINGENSITSKTNEEMHAAIYSKDDIRFEGEGKLTITSNLDGIFTKDDIELASGNYVINAEDDGIVGKDSVRVSGANIDITNNSNGIKTTNKKENGDIEIIAGNVNIQSKGDGIQSISNLYISGGNINIKAGNGSETVKTSEKSAEGFKITKEVIIDNGNINIDCEDDGFNVNGDVTINGGKIVISSNDDAIHSDSNLEFNNGDLEIVRCKEGIEAIEITVNGGDISINSNDDGFNASGGSDDSASTKEKEALKDNVGKITITDGKLIINSTGDGLDSNGSIYIKGGEIYIDGPIRDMDSAIDPGDFKAEYVITGGTVIAVGSSGMAKAPDNSSTQTSVLINLPSSYKDSFTFGNIKYEPKKTYQSIFISSDKLNKGDKYDLKIAGTKIQTVTLNKTVTTVGESSRIPGRPRGERR